MSVENQLPLLPLTNNKQPRFKLKKIQTSSITSENIHVINDDDKETVDYYQNNKALTDNKEEEVCSSNNIDDTTTATTTKAIKKAYTEDNDDVTTKTVFDESNLLYNKNTFEEIKKFEEDDLKMVKCCWLIKKKDRYKPCGVKCGNYKPVSPIFFKNSTISSSSSRENKKHIKYGEVCSKHLKNEQHLNKYIEALVWFFGNGRFSGGNNNVPQNLFESEEVADTNYNSSSSAYRKIMQTLDSDDGELVKEAKIRASRKESNAIVLGSFFNESISNPGQHVYLSREFDEKALKQYIEIVDSDLREYPDISMVNMVPLKWIPLSKKITHLVLEIEKIKNREIRGKYTACYEIVFDKAYLLHKALVYFKYVYQTLKTIQQFSELKPNHKINAANQLFKEIENTYSSIENLVKFSIGEFKNIVRKEYIRLHPDNIKIIKRLDFYLNLEYSEFEDICEKSKNIICKLKKVI